MELLLWRWSTTAQTASLLMIAIFFVVLARAIRRPELQTVVKAWLAKLQAADEAMYADKATKPGGRRRAG
jgi:hypothetical protein